MRRASFIGFRHAKRQRERARLRAHRGEVREIHRERLMAERPRGSTSGKKWRPATSMSVEIASMLAALAARAARSRRRCRASPSARRSVAGNAAAGWEKYRSIRENSESIGDPAMSRREAGDDARTVDARFISISGMLRREPAAGVAVMLRFPALSKWAMRRVLPVLHGIALLIGATMRSNFYSNLALQADAS